jgi:hypothetical protein
LVYNVLVIVVLNKSCFKCTNKIMKWCEEFHHLYFTTNREEYRGEIGKKKNQYNAFWVLMGIHPFSLRFLSLTKNIQLKIEHK